MIGRLSGARGASFRLLKGVLVAVLVAGAVVVPPSTAQALDTIAWTGWASSPDTGGRKLAVLSPTTDPATVGIVVDPAATRQKWLGVGASLTDSSVQLLAGRSAAWKLLYDPASTQGARLNLVRLPMSSTDFSTKEWSFTYDARTRKLTDTVQARQALAALASIRTVRSAVGVVAVPWSAPATFKTNGRLGGGALRPGTEKAYAAMLLAQVTWMRAKGVPLRALSIGNEPGYADASYASMTMTDTQMATIAKLVGPTLRAKNVGLWAVDHNFADRARVNAVVKAAPRTYTAAAYHCYSGSPSAMAGLSLPSIVTECTGMTFDDAAGSFAWDAQNLVAAAVDAGSTGLMFWNLALTATGGVKAAGGCASCRGVVTVDPKTGAVTPNAEFFTLAHLSRAADPGAVNLEATAPSGVPVAAFRNPDGRIGVYGYNPSSASQVVSVRVAGAGERRFAVGPHEMFTLRGLPGLPEATLQGKILRSTSGEVAYIDLEGRRHAIGDVVTFACLGGYQNAVENVEDDVFDAFTPSTDATCGLLGNVFAASTRTATESILHGHVALAARESLTPTTSPPSYTTLYGAHAP